MLQKCSHKLSKIIISGLGHKTYNEEILEYGLQILLGMMFKFFSIVAVSLALNTFPETLASLFAFATLRNFAGGVHCKTYALCYTSGVFMFALNGLIIKNVTVLPNYLILANNVLFILSLFITLKWVPAGTEKKVVSNISTRRKLKGITMVILGLLFILAHVFYCRGKFRLLTAVFLGVLEEMLFVTPLGYKIFRASYR